MDIIGKGIFTISEACRYLGTNRLRVSYWFRGGGLILSDYKDRRALSFLDLIDAKVALLFRENNVKMSELRTAYSELKKERLHPSTHDDLYHHDGSIYHLEQCKGGTPDLYRVATREGYFRLVQIVGILFASIPS